MAELPHSESPSLRAHKHQRTWQILVPLVGVSALIIATAILAVSGGAPQARVWADLSVIWMLAPLLTFAVLLIGVLGFLIYGFYRLFLLLPGYTARLQDFVFRVDNGARRVADGIARPFIWIHQIGAALESFLSLGSRK
jgi:hypothetical protein